MKNPSETRVAWWSRLLALLFVALATVALVSTGMSVFENTRTLSSPWPRVIGDIVGLLLFAYLVFLFAFAAFTGRAPARFLPGADWNVRCVSSLFPRQVVFAVGEMPVPPLAHPAREAAMRLRQPLFPWWAFWLFILVIAPVSRWIYDRFGGSSTPFWDFVGPLVLWLFLFGLFALYFMIRRLEDLVTVWRTRWPRTGAKRPMRDGE